ncbi:hypothetical protein GOP47_0006815 [Adiantum capillus-veneris]|uniref:Protein kinase domain-containing protein n=1 Tax=Adiantum capillus-veneris TaxID=13818 RepID=A0A9D4V401_ADICA|nr:hypothetical protein GOP47_0006815 [Adiantum capillus-veneris]
MGLLSQLTEIVLHCPFDEQGHYWLCPTQCQALCIYYCSNLERLFGTILRPRNLNSSSLLSTRRRNSFSAFYDKTFMKLRSNRKVSKSSMAALGDQSSAMAILEELRSIPSAIEELFRVMKEAEIYIQACSNSDWWRTAVDMGFMNEVRDVHIHDLMWCIAGLKLALQTVRGVELESRAQFTRLGVAQCYAEMGELSSQASELIRCEEQDYARLSSIVQEAKHKYDDMSFVRRMVMNGHDRAKHGVVHFLSQKLGVPSYTAEADSSSPNVRELPQSMRILIEDLSFASPPRTIAQGKFAVVYEASWLGMKVAAKQYDYDACKEYFTYEAAVHAKLRCPFIIQLYGWLVDSHNYSYYLVFELVNNNLASIVKDRKDLSKPLHLPVILDLMLQLSRAMDYLHSKGIMHKDIRPHNVLVQPSSSCAELMEKGYGRVKLCNFGFDRLNVDAAHWSALGYRAPEVWALHDKNRVEQLDYTLEADVYSFGMTFVYCLIGEDPFAGVASRTSLRDVVQKGVTLNLPPSCPLVLKDLLQNCLSKSLSARPSFTSITMALQHLKLLMMKSTAVDEVTNRLMVDEEFFLSNPVISYAELCSATSDFSTRVQNIFLHSMYHGVLSDGTKVLIQQMQGLINVRKLWLQTSRLLNLRHSNVAGLRAICIESSRYWFVIENSSVRGSLDKWLEADNTQEKLDVATCYRIAIGAACGLQYLHAQGIVYAVTAENILLDERYEPQLLVSSVQCEERDEDLEYHQRLDVLHFGTLITKLLSYLRGNNSIGDDSPIDSQVYVFQRVENLCSDALMDEVVELMESIYDSCFEESFPLHCEEEETTALDTEGSLKALESCHESFTSLFDVTQNLVGRTDSLEDEPFHSQDCHFQYI